jgi:hypothetical protein
MNDVILNMAKTALGLFMEGREEATLFFVRAEL